MNFHIITIFPQVFPAYFQEGVLGRAGTAGLINIHAYNLRDWTDDKHKTVDDTPYGGGAGIVMKVDPIFKAIQTLKAKVSPKHKVVLLSARGRKWTQRQAQKFSQLEDIILICGRYEEVDERVRAFIDQEISIGDYVLTGGELPAMVIIDSVARLAPGVLGNETSLDQESHTTKGHLDYPQYTRPEVFQVGDQKYSVPKVLLSGNHKKIKDWRAKKSSK